MHSASAANVIAMGVRDKGAIDGFPRVDVKAADLAEQTTIGANKKVAGSHT
jgi:hypothetical protein